MLQSIMTEEELHASVIKEILDANLVASVSLPSNYNDRNSQENSATFIYV